MSSTVPTTITLNAIMTRLSRGVVGVVDDLLGLCPAGGMRLQWYRDGCQIVASGETPVELAHVGVRKSAFRAILARFAVLCDSDGDPVSPYEGRGMITAARGDGTSRRFKVAFVNTTDDQQCDLIPTDPVAAEPFTYGSSLLNAFAAAEPLLPAGFARGTRANDGAVPQTKPRRLPAKWILSDSLQGDDRSVLLPSDGVSGHFDELEDDRISLTLEVSPVNDGGWEAVARVVPGPTREPFALTFGLSDRTGVTLIVPTLTTGHAAESASPPARLPAGMVPPEPGAVWELTILISRPPM